MFCVFCWNFCVSRTALFPIPNVQDVHEKSVNGFQTAVYLRISTSQQTTRSQKPDLERWLNAQEPEKLGKVVWYSDSATGKNMDRSGWQKLQVAIDTGRVRKVVVWRLDRLGRTASGLCKLFEDLQDRESQIWSV